MAKRPLKPKPKMVAQLFTLSDFADDDRTDGTPCDDHRNASLKEGYAAVALLVQDLSKTYNVPTGSKLMFSIEVVKEAVPKPPKAKKAHAAE
jgi:hypothetical protein